MVARRWWALLLLSLFDPGGDVKVFRTWGWPIALIVTEDIKEALERTGATGMKFTEV